MEIGAHARVIDKNSEFYGLTVIVTDKRVEPKPSLHTVYKVETTDGLPPGSYPFARVALRGDQLRYVSLIAEEERAQPAKQDAVPQRTGSVSVSASTPAVVATRAASAAAAAAAANTPAKAANTANTANAASAPTNIASAAHAAPSSTAAPAANAPTAKTKPHAQKPSPEVTLALDQHQADREWALIDMQMRKNYLLLTTIKAEFRAAGDACHEFIRVEKFPASTKDEIAEYIAKQNVRHLKNQGGVLELRGNPVSYEVLEIEKQPECIDEPVLLLFELEKTELEKASGMSLEKEINFIEMEKVTELTRSLNDRLQSMTRDKNTSHMELTKVLGIKPAILSRYFDSIDMDYDKFARAVDFIETNMDIMAGRPGVTAPDQTEKRLFDILDTKDKQIEDLEYRLKSIKKYTDRT